MVVNTLEAPRTCKKTSWLFKVFQGSKHSATSGFECGIDALGKLVFFIEHIFSHAIIWNGRVLHVLSFGHIGESCYEQSLRRVFSCGCVAEAVHTLMRAAKQFCINSNCGDDVLMDEWAHPLALFHVGTPYSKQWLQMLNIKRFSTHERVISGRTGDCRLNVNRSIEYDVEECRSIKGLSCLCINELEALGNMALEEKARNATSAVEVAP